MLFSFYINKNNTIASSNDDYIRIDRKTKKKKEKLEKALENKIESIEKEKEKIKEKERKIQLKELEKKYPEFIQKESYTQHVGGTVKSRI